MRIDSDKLLNWAIVAVVMAIVFQICAHSVAECLWSHLRNGIGFLEAGGVMQRDPYSYMSDVPWIDHEWLFEMAIAALYKNLGIIGMTVMKLTVMLVLFSLLFFQLLRNRINVLIAGAIVLLVAMMLAPWHLAVRPHMFSLLFFPIVLMILSAAEDGHRKWLWAVPFLIAIWCNLHGGFVAGFGVVSIWCVFDSLQFLWEQRTVKAITSSRVLQNIAVVVTGFLATLLNPYGWHLPYFLLTTLSVPRPEFPDWSPVSLLTPVGKYYAATIFSALVILLLSRKSKSWASLAVLAIVSLQPLSAIRHVFLVILTVPFLFARHISDVIDRSGFFIDLGKFSNGIKVGFASALLVASALIVGTGMPFLTEIRLAKKPPAAAVSFLQRSGVSGNIANYFGWGDYCIWHLYPKFKVSWDARRETTFSEKALGVNMKWTYGLLDWDELLKRYPTDIVMASKEQAHYALMRLNPDWEQCYEDDLGGIFARHGSDIAQRLKQTKPEPAEKWVFP